MPDISKTRCIGILTSGGDCPGLNAAIRAIAKPAIHRYGMQVIGILDGFRGLVEKRTIPLHDRAVSGILTLGGTILGTSRDKPHKMPMGDQVIDMTQVAVDNAREMQIDCLVCLGGGGTQKNAYRLMKQGGLPVITLPKTIDNDVAETEITFGFDTARGIATDAIDRLHTTATSHHRIIVCEIMGHSAGWLSLESGIAGGADVILIPEIPYDIGVIGEYIQQRRRTGKRFSIIAAAEGALSTAEAGTLTSQQQSAPKARKKTIKGSGAVSESAPKTPMTAAGGATEDETREGTPVMVTARPVGGVRAYHLVQESKASRIARHIQECCGVEARVTSLGHVQRGGIPTSFDRLLCTLLGTRAADLLAQGIYNVMVGYHAGQAHPVPIEQVAGKRKLVPPDHPTVESARAVGTCFGDR